MTNKSKKIKERFEEIESNMREAFGDKYGLHSKEYRIATEMLQVLNSLKNK